MISCISQIGQHFSFSVVWLALVWADPSSAASACDLSSDSLIFSTQVHVAGHERVRVNAKVPSFSEVIATAAAIGIDVHLVLVDQSGNSQLFADTPIRRWGPQRIIANVGDRADLVFEMVGKEHPGAQGSVRLDIFRLSDLQGKQACINGYKLLASGDSHYAKAELITAGTKGTSGDANEEYAAAVKAYQDAASALATTGRSVPLAIAYLSEAATFYQGLQHWTEAKQAALESANAYEAANEDYGVARARAMGAAAEMEIALSAQSNNPQGLRDRGHILGSARETFSELAALHRRRHEPFDEALALNNVGIGFYYEGDYQGAIGAYSQAEPIYARLGEKPRDAQVRQNLALVEYELGRFSDAKRNYIQALKLIVQNDNPKLYAEILNNRALAEYVSGDLDAALEHYSAALSILTDIQVTREQARSLQGIGAVYYAAGDREQAIDYFKRSLALRSEALDPRGRGASLRSLASVLSGLNRPSESLALREQALALAAAPSARLRIETQIAGDLQKLGRREDSRAAIDRGIIEARDNAFGKALALMQRASLEYEEKSYSQAEADIAVSVNTLERTETPPEDFAALLLAAQISQRLHAEKSAGALVDRALRVAEQIRTESANPELRAGLWQPIRPAFDFKINLQVASVGGRQTDRDRVALATLTIAERFRARSLKDYWRQVAGSNPVLTRGKLDGLYREIADRRAELETRLDRSPESDPRVRAIRRDIAGLRRQIDTLSGYSATHARAMSAARETGTDSIQVAVETIPADMTVIEYWLGEENAWAWVINRGKVRMIDLGRSKPLELAARDLYASLGAFSTVKMEDRQRLAANLYALAIEPLPGDALRLPNLVIIPDGALHYIPFAVLRKAVNAEGLYLIDNHFVASAASLAGLAAHGDVRARTREDQVLIVSDPVYSVSDERIPPRNHTVVAKAIADSTSFLRMRSGSADGQFERLPGTAREAQAISALFSPAELNSLSGLDASREAFLSLDLSRFRIIHIAAHAISDVEAPRLSTMVLSTVDKDGRPVTGNVFSGELLLRRVNADVFVLSACDTAVGREVAGEGLLGLRYAALAAGAKSVVASMWQVPDRPGAEIMTAFYVHLISDHEPPASALAYAMRESRQRFSDPAIWGAFDISVTDRDLGSRYSRFTTRRDGTSHGDPH
jgi:CHAT domain-containing protein/tetratricopeptide (TPR) repeat protein